jgi:excisionase family DNA binding protein
MKRVLEEKFSMKQAAARIGVHVATVSRLLDSGKLGYYQVGTRRIVGQTHLEEFLSLAERKRTAKVVS